MPLMPGADTWQKRVGQQVTHLLQGVGHLLTYRPSLRAREVRHQLIENKVLNNVREQAPRFFMLR
jgi:hypothetical protein